MIFVYLLAVKDWFVWRSVGHAQYIKRRPWKWFSHVHYRQGFREW